MCVFSFADTFTLSCHHAVIITQKARFAWSLKILIDITQVKRPLQWISISIGANDLQRFIEDITTLNSGCISSLDGVVVDNLDMLALYTHMH